MTVSSLEDRRLERDAVCWRLFKAYMARSVRTFQTLATTSIVFDDKVTASEFHREILQKAARK